MSGSEECRQVPENQLLEKCALRRLRIFFQEGFPARVYDPSDAGFRRSLVNGCGYGQGVDDIPHRAGFDKEKMLRPLMGILNHGMARG